MCLVAIAWKVHPDFPLVISANRDEFFERPTQNLHQWESGIYAGKDLRSGGTWMGFHPNGRWALLTNYRDFSSILKPTISRGKLVQNWLENQITPEEYLTEIEKTLENYDGFNLLVSDGKSLWYLSNYGKGVEEIRSGIHGISNGLLNDPWPKTELAKGQMKKILEGIPTENKLLDILKSTETYSLEDLPKTGVLPEMEIGLSAQLIRLNDTYGTVSATAVIQNSGGLVRMKERKFEKDFHKFSEQEYLFQIN
jgi:uncharacterized protein with NRDE domain